MSERHTSPNQAYSLEPAVVSSRNPEVVRTFAHNARMLSEGVSEALEGDSFYQGKPVGDKPNFVVPMIMYVDTNTGMIKAIASYEKRDRAMDKMTGPNPEEVKQRAEAGLTGLPAEELNNPDTARIRAYKVTALPDIESSEKFDRPASWVRNSIVRLGEGAQESLEETIPDSLSRAILTESIKRHNSQPEPDTYVHPEGGNKDVAGTTRTRQPDTGHIQAAHEHDRQSGYNTYYYD